MNRKFAFAVAATLLTLNLGACSGVGMAGSGATISALSAPLSV
jgi:hypothetical protein